MNVPENRKIIETDNNVSPVTNRLHLCSFVAPQTDTTCDSGDQDWEDKNPYISVAFSRYDPFPT